MEIECDACDVRDHARDGHSVAEVDQGFISNWLYENAELMTSLSRHREPLSSFYLGVLTI